MWIFLSLAQQAFGDLQQCCASSVHTQENHGVSLVQIRDPH